MTTTPDFEREPALTIGNIFANKAMIKTYVAAILGIVATGTRFVADDALIENIATVVQLAAVILTPFVAQYENGERAEQQAKATREAVYAPETVQAIVEEVEAERIVPVARWGVSNIDKGTDGDTAA